MLRRLILFVIGYLRIEVSKGNLEAFLNGALAREAVLWQVTRRPGRFFALVTIQDFFRLRAVARQSRCRVRIRGRFGLPFRLVRLKRRPMLLLGAAASLAFLAWATSHVWFVQVRINGPQVLDSRAVMKVAAEAGVRPGVAKADVDIPAVQAHLMKRLHEISWAGLRVQGTRIVIEVVEKAGQNPAKQDACINLYADKAGVIEQVVAFRGEARVKRGDVVRPGDLLVECVLRYWSGGRPQVYPGTPLPPREDIARIVVSNAQVKARVLYQDYQEIPLVQEVRTPTGETATRWVLNWKEKPIILRGKEPYPFEEYEEHRKVYRIGPWRNWIPPVEFVVLTAEEVTVYSESLPVERAVQNVETGLRQQLQWALGPRDKVISPPKAHVVERQPGWVGIRLRAETLEEIGEPREGSAFAPVPAAQRGEQP